MLSYMKTLVNRFLRLMAPAKRPPMNPSTNRKLRFTRVTIGNWRNFGQVDVQLEPRIFLVGPNASGKSNFLDIFRFLSDISTQRDGLQDAVNKPCAEVWAC